MTWTYDALIRRYENVEQCRIVLRADAAAELCLFAKRYVENSARYKTVAERVEVPAELVAAIHWREASGNFNTYLHNGDPLGKPVVHEPRNVPLFCVWEEAAVHALALKFSPLHALEITQATGLSGEALQRLLAFAEIYNGLGYYYRGLPSPYVLSGTDLYRSGKFVADGKFDLSAVDAQLGVYVLMHALHKSCDAVVQGTEGGVA